MAGRRRAEERAHVVQLQLQDVDAAMHLHPMKSLSSVFRVARRQPQEAEGISNV
jgi:hypothetical protein